MIALVNVSPSPLAVTVTVVEVTVAVAAAVSVKVLVPHSEESVSGLLLHVAVTPVGNPLTLSATAPLYVPFPANVSTSLAEVPCMTDSELEAEVIVNVGGVSVTYTGTVAAAVTVAPVAATT